MEKINDMKNILINKSDIKNDDQPTGSCLNILNF